MLRHADYPDIPATQSHTSTKSGILLREERGLDLRHCLILTKNLVSGPVREEPIRHDGGPGPLRNTNDAQAELRAGLTLLSWAPLVSRSRRPPNQCSREMFVIKTRNLAKCR
ncbi:hypothetical protein CEXT_41711 [Caerostris extrusa]|uniref:Uncharacterized protein n=1 Tax=Caerostris extrusa TaxID=172846 RepID=A0AAV4VAB6_CAEEX|nr:hypothetical protein CEXT_41711 [Caerostris extrusa]